ncbi:hypothetical protein CBL_07857 [Carabus blaptoides fortunei]
MIKTCSKYQGWRSHEPVPKTSNRLLATFTPDERLALYEYSVAATQGPPEVPEFNMSKPKIEERHNLTADELKAIHRDARRRRIKYKSKCVHTNRKSTTEVLRDVIESQMEQYEDYLRDEQDGGSVAGLTEYSDGSYSRERELRRDGSGDYYEERSYSKEKRDEYDYSRRRDDDDDVDKGSSKREVDQSYNKREEEKSYSKREEDKSCTKRDDKSYSKREEDQSYNSKGGGEEEGKGCDKRENYDDKGHNKPDNYKDTSLSKTETDHDYDNKRTSKEEATKDINKQTAENHTNTIKVHTKGYLKEYSAELRNNFPQPEQQQQFNNKKHQSLVEAELEHENNETASPRSSRSQNSYRSQESRHRGRPRTPTEPSYRERSRSRERRHRHQRSRRYDQRDRKYHDRRHYDRQRSDR